MAQLHVQCWQESYVGLMPPELLSKHDFTARLALWQGLLAEQWSIIVAAFDDCEAAGFAIARANLCTVMAGC